MRDLTPVHAGLLRETFPGERRVALTPSDVARLSQRMTISFETGCGAAAGYDDDAYIAAGARPAGIDCIAANCNIIVSVRRRSHDIAFPEAAAFVYLGSDSEALASHHMRNAAVELDVACLEGLDDAGCMDVSTTQATITGHAAVLEGARQLGIGHPMLMLDGSFVKPVKVAALGCGAAALQALATARRLGALTYGFGFGDSDKRKVESLGAKFIALDPVLLAPRATASRPKHLDARRKFASDLSEMQLIIASVVDHGGPTPLLIDQEVVTVLAAGTVIIDLAVASGGNCTLTKAEEVVTNHDVRIIGSTTLASNEANEASRLFSDGVSKFLDRLADHGLGALSDNENAALSRLVKTRDRRASMAS